ncbi:separin [Pyrenophora seminiperda CCB06]|uniref:separase n=1 Tax=Pyrenophora seminiperda CCB06 TaxID=1302712 RepID=A0A3M7MCR5_9PLEO|nr:separin [Pyrenophora seminiperda CCB06]
MVAKDETTRARIDNIKAELLSTSTCTSATVAALEELLLKKEEAATQKENVRVKVQTTAAARRRAGTATAAASATVDVTKQKCGTLAPREKYILATEVANKTLQTLADALKNPALAIASSKSKPVTAEDARKPARPRPGHTTTSSTSQKPLRERSISQINNSPQKRVPRRSSSYSSFLSPGPDPGIVATAECARTAFAYLGTPEASKVLGKDSQELQYENGVLVLIGKLVALGLDNLASKELRALKKRLDRYLTRGAGKEPLRSAPQHTGTAEKDGLASLLDFAAINSKSPAVPLVASFQSYTLRIIAKLKRPRTVEATWDYLKMSNPSSPANLLWHTAKTPTSQAKAARQLESLAQTVLSLCPSVSSADDANTLQPSAETVLLLQHLAFSIRKQWWGLVNHQGNEVQELAEPFAKCLIAFARRSQLIPSKKYKLAETLYADLVGLPDDFASSESGTASSTANKALYSLAQAAGLSDRALRWLGSSKTSSASSTSAAKQAARTIRIAIITLEAYLKGDKKSDLEETITNALEALHGSLGGSAVDLETLFAEVNSLRRTATKLLVASLSVPATAESSSIERYAVPIIAASVHFSARFLGTRLPDDADARTKIRHRERITVAWKCVKSTLDSVVACCKQNIKSPEEWKEMDTVLQECSRIIRRFEEEFENGTFSNGEGAVIIGSYTVKLSNAYWALYLQLRKARCNAEHLVVAMQRSIDLLESKSTPEKVSGLLPMKLEQLGDAYEDLQQSENSRNAYRQCLNNHLNEDVLQQLSEAAARSSVSAIFTSDGPLNILARVLKAYHHLVVKFGVQQQHEVAFYDDEELEPGARGALLEVQTGFFSRTLSRNRQWDSSLNKSICILAERLQQLYPPQTYPIRHLRLSVTLLQLSQHDLPVVFEQPSLSDLAPDDKSRVSGSQDEALKNHERHLKALCMLKFSMRDTSPSTSILRKCFATWESIVNSATSWAALEDCIDNTETWLQDLQACLEFLNAKGEEYLALPLLHLLIATLELRKDSDASELVTTLSILGLQFIRLGYSGKAGLSLAKAEALIHRETCSVEAKLQWHMAYSEYLLGIGNTAKCLTIMSNAQSIALADSQFMNLAKPTTTLSGRLRFNRILADASYIQSLLATSTGLYRQASRHARQCVTLNRRIWAALESRVNVRKMATAEDTDSDAGAAFDPLMSVRNDKGMPLVMSVTHDALSGPEFWSLVPALYRALMQQSQIFAHQGLLHEAIHVAEQAGKIASSTGSATLMTDNTSWRADCWAQSGRPDKAESILNTLSLASSRKCLSTAGYHSAIARTHHWNNRYGEEIESYVNMEQLLKELSSSLYMRSLETFSPSVDALADQISSLALQPTAPSKARVGTRGRKPVAKAAPKVVPKSVTNARTRTTAAATAKAVPKSTRQAKSPTIAETPSIADQCSALQILQASMRDRAILANILHDDLTRALELLREAEEVQSGMDQEVSHMWATFKARLAQSTKQIAEDFNVNTLPESTIAFPAFGLKESTSSETATTKKGTVAPSKGGRTKKRSKEDFMETLREARERLVEAHSLCATNGSNHLFRQTSMALGHVTVLMSAVCGSELPGSLHPLYAAYMSEVPKVNALRLVQESTEGEKEQMSRDECLQWPVLDHSRFALGSISDFQKDYIDIIPDTWTAVSLELSEARDELFITRFESGLSPFVLRLPLARHASREMDEEEFSFADGKRDFDEIIELSDFSTRSAKDMTSREARQQWWAEREALDTRLHELLINMENIWLGGFKGVFSQFERQPTLLARFRKSFESILNNHLPSRRKKSQQKRPILDTRVLELFVGLGDATNEDLDLDESLMDLIYFVVDVLQFNGEHNAYDELDFDAMVVETYEALRAYHSASQKLNTAIRHTILILDNNLHAFPWESLPCLEQLSISRLPSLAALRERLLSAQSSTGDPNAAPGHYICPNAGGTSMLNPSGDLAHTSKTIKPHLEKLQGRWDHIANRAPSEKEFEDSLREKDLVLYFGHGCGAQYVKSKSVRRLYPGPQDTVGGKPGCATTLLFGCSSVHLTENGIFEPSGMLASYLTAGAPAVVGMLWDVTDKDCDRLAVRAGELWGLWPAAQEDALPLKTPAKTAAKKSKGKGRVAQLADDGEGVGHGGSAKKGKKTAKTVDEDASDEREEGRGVVGLDEAIKEARSACVLRYLNGAAAVVYGIPRRSSELHQPTEANAPKALLIVAAPTSTMMAERPTKAGPSRKRALVSCDRCKIRRARCIRDNADVPCADCKAAGVQCESKLPRKQRVYGSVETLSLRYRALESLVKGLFPNENVQDTETLFKLAAARNISMPASDDFTPADIFSKTEREAPTPGGQRQEPSPNLPRARMAVTPIQSQSTQTTSVASTTPKHHHPNPATAARRPSADVRSTHTQGSSHYFGPSSSFRLATTIRALAARWKAASGTDFPGMPLHASAASMNRSSTNPSEEDYALPRANWLPIPTGRSRKRSRSQVESSSDQSLPREVNSNGETIGDFLPEKHIANALVAAYFDHVHTYMPLFNRSVFHHRLEETYSRQLQPLEESKQPGWLVTLALVFAFGCQQVVGLDAEQTHELRLKYLIFAKGYFRQLLTTTCLDNVQALVLHNLHHHNIGQKSSSWLLIGLAARMSITMGMHRDSSNLDFDPVERDMRRQVWWTIYIFEKTLCSILGRPTAIDDREMSMHIPEAPMLKETGVSATFMSLGFELVRMSYTIRQHAYFDHTSAEERSPTLAVATSLLRQCDNFFASIPPHMSVDYASTTQEERATILLLHIYYYYTRCIITRDFLVHKVESHITYLEEQTFPVTEDWQTTLLLAEDCVESVHRSLQCITIGINLGIIGYSWLDFFYVFHAVLIVCADFLARPREQTDSAKDTERKVTVRTVLDQVRGMQRLAPTYKTLSQIALQFASITGVTEDRKPPIPIETQQEPLPIEPPGAMVDDWGMEHLIEISDLGEDWFTNATTDLGLDFFDLSNSHTAMVFPPPDPISHAGTMGNPTADAVDDWTARTLRGMHTI